MEDRSGSLKYMPLTFNAIATVQPASIFAWTIFGYSRDERSPRIRETAGFLFADFNPRFLFLLPQTLMMHVSR